MAAHKFPDGVKDYRALVTGGYRFVDKTMMIRDVCEADDMVILCTRPRWFGKSINLSMLDYYFNRERAVTLDSQGHGAAA
ncbi:MAG: AAA family ATPase [Candidatus Methanomethylophilaceae archaeon]|nr:AAA family ATPase [Candidatus Methanomethylophilaceae archaeon]